MSVRCNYRDPSLALKDTVHVASCDILSNMQVRVLYFGALREAAGISEQTIFLKADAISADVFAYVREHLPQMAGLLARSAIAVNQSYVSPEHPLKDGDEIALLPPVSGGTFPLV